jgi:hypothetical protein
MGRKALALVLAALLLAGCEIGGDGGSTEKEQFIQQADSVCQQYGDRIGGIPAPQTFLRDFAVYMRRAVPIARAQNRELRAMTPPEDQAADFNRMIQLLDQQLDLAAQAGEEAYAGREARAQAAMQESLGPADEAARVAARIGFTTCARPSS